MPNGAKCADLCCNHGMSEGTYYNWKAKFGGVTVSEARRLKSRPLIRADVLAFTLYMSVAPKR